MIHGLFKFQIIITFKGEHFIKVNYIELIRSDDPLEFGQSEEELGSPGSWIVYENELFSNIKLDQVYYFMYDIFI